MCNIYQTQTLNCKYKRCTRHLFYLLGVFCRVNYILQDGGGGGGGGVVGAGPSLDKDYG